MSILNVMMEAHSLSCMLHTGHLASEVRPHSWLSNGGKVVEGPLAIPQDAAVDNLAILKRLCLHFVDCSNVWLAWSRLHHNFSFFPQGCNTFHCIPTAPRQMLAQTYCDFSDAMPSKPCLMQSISGQGMPVEALTCLPGNDLHPPVALWDAAPAEACDSAASAVGPARRPLSLQSKKHEVAAYTAVHLADSPGQEVSFEEVRAAKWLARQTNIMPRVRCSFFDIPYSAELLILVSISHAASFRPSAHV